MRAISALSLLILILLISTAQAQYDLETWNEKGWSSLDQGRYEEAIKFFDQAISLAPDFGCPYNGKGLALAALGRYDESIDAFNRSLQLVADNPDAWSNMGIGLFLLKRYDESLRPLEKAIAMKPFLFSEYDAILYSKIYLCMK
ncbi:MAG TPA: tetratricopeptide repeat protein [Methanotrichaceae archaeon]|nr:tetratricopeptide repeat protein [Methanotrichaceae archaeon]